ncbi:MAG TPA: type III secretion system inner membrane ring subunit SctD [Magnetospirillum sp.]|nr:type III secretion system inner membrane ring subunit SctD [Magnetospirillum sp.]
MEKQFEIKVLSGVQAGAKAILHASRVVVGSADDCDIVLAADDVLAHHAAISLSDSGAKITGLEGEVFRADGTLVSGDEPLAPHEPIGLGGMMLAIGAVGTPWPRIDLSTFGRRPVAAEGPTNATTANTTTANATTANDGPMARPLSAAGQRMPVAGREKSGGLIRLASVGRVGDGLGRTTLYPLIALLVVGIGFIGFTWFGEQSPAEAAAGTPTETARVAEALRKVGLDGTVEIRPLRDGAVLLNGYVELSSQKRTLTEGIIVPGVEIFSRIWAQEELVKAAQQRLSELAPGLTVTPVAPGVIAVGGYLATPERRGRIVSTIREDVPGLREVIDRIVTVNDAARTIKSAVAESSLNGKVRVEVADGMIVARGSVNNEGMAAWNAVVASVLRDNGQTIPIRAEFVPDLSELPFTIRGIVSGPIRYVVTDNGRRVAEGGQLGGGFSVASVGDGEVTIVGQGQKFVQRFKE